MSEAEDEEKDGFGLDKEARLRAKRERMDEKGRPEPLDPPFPYRLIAFDLNMLNVAPHARFGKNKVTDA